MVNPPDLGIVIRSAGERTLTACKNRLEKFAGDKPVAVISERPFSKAVAKTFELGLTLDVEWLLVIDADVLIDEEGLNQLMRLTAGVPEHVFEIQGLVIDKFLMAKRPAGNHLYRTSHLSKAQDFLGKAVNELRPESFIIGEMSKIGHTWYQSSITVGHHDFEQSYKDIFRKLYLHSRKHPKQVNLLESVWNGFSTDDKDFEVALLGAYYGKITNTEVIVDVEIGGISVEEKLEIHSIEEKEPLATPDLYLKEKSINNFNEVQELVFPMRHCDHERTLKTIVPLYKKVLFKFGLVLNSIARKFMNWGNH